MSGMAAMLGIGGMSLGSEADALNVSLFPDIVASTPFILELFNAHVTTLDGEVDTTFVAYLDEQKAPWWGAVMGLPGAAIGGVKSLFSDKGRGRREQAGSFPPDRRSGEESGSHA